VDIRRNIYSLGAGSFTVAQFASALNTLKANGTYDAFIHRHHDAMMRSCLLPGETGTQRNAAHRGPSFGPWHRYYLRDLERALQSVTPGMTLPYWPWENDAALADPRTAALWTAAYIGSDGAGSNDFVPNGPFQHWVGLVMSTGMGLSPRPTAGIVRRLGRDPFGGVPTLPGLGEVNNSLGETPYDNAPWSEVSTPSFRNRLEGWLRRPTEPAGPRMHNRVHTWVGGDMMAGTSPNDPVFFLHHANIDRLWARWQASPAGAPYGPTIGAPPGHGLNDAMFDLGTAGVTPAACLDHFAMGYMYDTESPGLAAQSAGEHVAIQVSAGNLTQLSVMYSNIGMTSWLRGGATQVNLVPAPVHSPSAYSAWASNWVSPSAYATPVQTVVPPGQLATFTFNVRPPANTPPGQYTFEGELVLASTGVPLQSPTYRQVVIVQ
jgi:tyrosinase